MKKIVVKNVQEWQVREDVGKATRDMYVYGPETMDASDGYHTFTELYEHRIELYLAICRVLVNERGGHVWRAKSHSDGSVFDGWFVVGIGTEEGKQITYHLPMSKWEDTDFIEELERAPEWDKHTPVDVLERLKTL